MTMWPKVAGTVPAASRQRFSFPRLMRDCHCHFIFLVSLMICLSGCITTKDITRDPRYPTDYIKGAVYQFKQPVFVVEDGSDIIPIVTSVILHRSGDFGGPGSIQEYTYAPKKWKDDQQIAGFVQVGTKIRIVDVQLMRHPENGNTIWIKGRLIDTPWSKMDAELHFISREVRQADLFVDLPMVDTNILELVTKP